MLPYFKFKVQNSKFKIVVILISLLTFNFTLLISPAYAQAPAFKPAPSATLSASNYKAEQNADFALGNILHGLLCQGAGMSSVGGCIGRTKDNQGNIISYLYDRVPDGGAIGGLTGILATLYTTPPTSTKEYLANLGKNFGLVHPSYAAVTGSGANIIRPVEKLWDVMKNISYLAYIVIFIAIGFMIMFRQKVGSQAVITIQQALPGLVIGLILITFSYFIAALIVDLSFISIRVVASVFTQVNLNVFDPNKLAQESNIFNIFTSSVRFGDNFKDISEGVGKTINSLGGETAAAAISGIVGLVVGGLVFGIPGALIGGLAGAALGGSINPLPGIIGLLVPTILIVALIIQFFKLFYKLLMSYIMLLITTVIGPLLILVGTIPGKGGVLSFWWKNLLGHSLAFPATFGMFLFAGMILATPSPDWGASPPFFGGLSTVLLRVLIAYGIILGTPAVPDLVKKLIGAQDIGEIGKEGMGGFMAGFGVTKGAAKVGFDRLSGPTQRLRTEYRTLQEEKALGKITPAGDARLTALSRGTGSWLPSRIQKWLTEAGNKPFSGKR